MKTKGAAVSSLSSSEDGVTGSGLPSGPVGDPETVSLNLLQIKHEISSSKRADIFLFKSDCGVVL